MVVDSIPTHWAWFSFEAKAKSFTPMCTQYEYTIAGKAPAMDSSSCPGTHTHKMIHTCQLSVIGTESPTQLFVSPESPSAETEISVI